MFGDVTVGKPNTFAPGSFLARDPSICIALPNTNLLAGLFQIRGSGCGRAGPSDAPASPTNIGMRVLVGSIYSMRRLTCGFTRRRRGGSTRGRQHAQTPIIRSH